MSKNYLSFFPPYLYLVQILEHCPEAGFTYLMLWREMDHNKSITYNKKTIVDEKCIPWKKFKNDLRLLSKGGFIEFSATQDDKVVTITCAELNDDDSPWLGRITC